MPSPYVLISNDYWSQPREVCVVDEINCLEYEDAEVIVTGSKTGFSVNRVRRWLEGLPVNITEEDDKLGNFVRFVCRKIN